MTTDSIADLLTRVRNAYRASAKSVIVPVSSVNKSILEVLKKEGFVENYSVKKEAIRSFDGIDVVLKYYENGEPVISKAQRVSKPGRRVYVRGGKIAKVENGLGISIVSTSQGIMSDRDARKKKIGGELLAQVA
jgi:small subunit ribosomal protein S8